MVSNRPTAVVPGRGDEALLRADVAGIHVGPTQPSCPGLSRASTSFIGPQMETGLLLTARHDHQERTWMAGTKPVHDGERSVRAMTDTAASLRPMVLPLQDAVSSCRGWGPGR